MRLTGAADVLEPVDKTLPGKLPQKTITKQAANGYSSYGNQIGLATQWFLKSMTKATKQKEWKLVSLPEPFL
jgi:phosphoribosylformylglycinamidine synthase